MINNQMLAYVRQQLSVGVGREVITTNLKSAGWSDADISEVFAAIIPATMSTSTPISPVFSSTMPNVAQMQTVQTSLPKRKSKKIFFIILILILFGLAGAGVYAYYSGVFVSLPSLVGEAMDNARLIKTANYDVTLGVDFSEMKSITSGLSSIPSLGINSTQLGFTIKGSSDITDPKNLKNSSTISVNLGSISLEAELRLLNNTLYAELTKSPVLGMLPIPSLSQYENKWFSLPYKSADGQIVSNPLTTLSPVNPNIASKFTTDQKDHIYKMFRDAHFIKQIARLSPETISGESSYHFTFDLDRDGINSYLQSLKAYINTIGKDDSQLSAFNLTSFTQYLEKIKDFQGEVWIGRNDKLIHKIVLNFGVQPDSAKNEQVKVDMVSIVSGYNQPVSIVAPIESTPFADLISASMADARQKAKEASIKANLANLRPEAELFYMNGGDSYSGFCSSSKSNLKAVRKAIEDAGGTGFICRDASKSYAIAVKLSQSSGYWCVDSTGVLKSTTTSPPSTVCPVK